MWDVGMLIKGTNFELLDELNAGDLMYCTGDVLTNLMVLTIK